MKVFLQKQAVITTTMTKYIYNVFNLSFTLLTRKKNNNKQIYRFIFFFFVPKKCWDAYSICSAYVVRILFRTHVNGFEQGYSIRFIWGPDYQTENLKGAKGVGAVPISFWEDL